MTSVVVERTTNHRLKSKIHSIRIQVTYVYDALLQTCRPILKIKPYVLKIVLTLQCIKLIDCIEVLKCGS